MDEVEFHYGVVKRRRKLLTLACCILALEEENENNDARQRSCWTTPYLLRREAFGMHRNLFLELALEDPNRFRRCLRMDVNTFEYLLQKVAPMITKQDTTMRPSIPADQKLSLTLRHLATGESQESLRLSFRIGQSTISTIIKETCSAIYLALHEEFLQTPSTEAEWLAIAHDFYRKWNFPNCLGAMDGKHCRIDPLLNSGSQFYAYKGFCSVVLFALVDADLRFVYINAGTNGRMSDTAIWNRCSLKAHLEQKSLNTPSPKSLPDTNTDFPFVILGDEIFPLQTDLLIPFPKDQLRYRVDRKISNYRLSRARRTSENAFGILVARIQIFRSPMRYDPDVAAQIIETCCCLHNMLRTQTLGRAMYTPYQFVDRENLVEGRVEPGEWREEAGNGLEGMEHQGGNRHPNDAME